MYKQKYLKYKTIYTNLKKVYKQLQFGGNYQCTNNIYDPCIQTENVENSYPNKNDCIENCINILKNDFMVPINIQKFMDNISKYDKIDGVVDMFNSIPYDEIINNKIKLKNEGAPIKEINITIWQLFKVLHREKNRIK